jgi:hypothetical protein
MLKRVISLIITSLLLNSCSVSYPKNSLIQDLERLVKKEYGLDSKAFIVGKTLYLDIKLNELTSKNLVDKMQAALQATIRAVLSSDSDTKYIVVTVYNRDKSISFRIACNIDDVKRYCYKLISHSDYESRIILELYGPPIVARIAEDRYDITDSEYIGRLIASQLNNIIFRANPEFDAFASSFQLHYLSEIKGNLILLISGNADEEVISIVESFLKEGMQEYFKKYSISFTGVKVITSTGKTMIHISS